MAYTQEEMRILNLMAEDCRKSAEQIALELGLDEKTVSDTLKKFEKDKIIVGYPALVNWDKTDVENVKAVIEVKVTPQRDMGFDAIAARIYRFEEVTSVYLMSGGFDLLVEVQARSMKTLATFVSQKLATIDNVLSTATHFVLKKYKVDGTILEEDQTDNRLAVTP